MLWYIADLLHKLELSVSFEMFKHETGYDLFQVSLRHQMEEQMQLMGRPGYDEMEPQVIYKLNDVVNGQSYYNQNPELSYDRDIVNEIWDDLNLWPSIEPNRKPIRRKNSEYSAFFLNLPTLMHCNMNRKAMARPRPENLSPVRRSNA